MDLGRQFVAHLAVALRTLHPQSAEPVMWPEFRDLVASIVGFAIYDPLATFFRKERDPPYFGYRGSTPIFG